MNPKDRKSYERGFAGSLLHKPDRVLELAKSYKINNLHFDDEIARKVFVAATALHKAEKPLDAFSIKTESGLDVVIIQRLMDDCPTVGNVEFFIQALRDEHIKKQALESLKNAQGASGIELALDSIRDMLPSTGILEGFSLRSWGECKDMDLPDKKYFLGNLFACGQMQVMFGQGGLGKSRIATNIARNQVLGTPFLGQATGKKPLKHLFIGSENDIHRWQIDVRAMSKELSKDQIDLLSENIRMSTLENCDDVSINLGDSISLQKWTKTLHTWIPDVLWVDPWGDVIEGEGFDSDVRSTIRTLRKIAQAVNTDCGIVILAHSRTGASNIIQAAGIDGANFGKDSKALFSTARAVVNMAPYDGSDNPELVWVAAKNNNGPRPESLRIALDPETLTYNVVETLDVEAWQAAIKKAGLGRKRQHEPELDGDAIKALFSDGPMPKLLLEDELKARGFTVRGTKSWITGMLHKKQIVEQKTGKRNQKLIGTSECF